MKNIILKTFPILILTIMMMTFGNVEALAQSADQEVISVVDSPDPVAPGSTLSYMVTFRNNGPDSAVNGGININLPLAVTYLSAVTPAGFTCFFLGNTGTCNTASFAAGATQVITVNTQVGANLANFPDQNISANFFTSGTTADPDNSNNSKTAITTVSTPPVTAATVSISGYVTTPTGRGISGIQLSLIDSEGNVRTSAAGLFGYYRFDDVQAGETYIISAAGKRFIFSQPVQVLNINEEANQVNFIANSEKKLRMF